MGLTRSDLTNPRLSDKDKSEIKVALDNYMKNDEWVNKYFNKIGILLTSHPGNRPYLRPSIDSYKKLGLWITLAYDNHINPETPEVNYNDLMPPKDVMDLLDCFVMPKYNTWGGVLFPYFWQLVFGFNAMADFEYVLCANADTVFEKPEAFPQLFAMMGDADIMSCGPSTDRSINTVAFIVKTSAMKKIMKHYADHFIPFENYEKFTDEIGNAEGRLGAAVRDLGLKQVIVEPPMNDQLHVPGKGTWYQMVGFRHPHAECNYAYRYKGIPPDPKYIDKRFAGDWDTINKYWETKDIKIIENWWAKE